SALISCTGPSNPCSRSPSAARTAANPPPIITCVSLMSRPYAPDVERNPGKSRKSRVMTPRLARLTHEIGGRSAGDRREEGSRAAARGVPWTVLLAETETAFDRVGAAPPYRVVRALSVAWVETSLQYVHEMSCEDPLTGLATLAHMRSRLDEVYRLANRDGC